MSATKASSRSGAASCTSRAVILALAAAGVTARDVQLGASNLEDAFVALTSQDSSENDRDDEKEGALV